MPADINAVTLIGRLTKDAEGRDAGQTKIVECRLAVTSRTKSANGTWGDKSNYFDVAIFGNQGASLQQWLTKGRRIAVQGRLNWREWETQEGVKRQAVTVVANDVQLLEAPQGNRQVDDDDNPFG